MGKYHINEATLELSDGWEDRSINGFVYSKSDEPELSIIISRLAVVEHEDLRRFVSAQIQILSNELDDIRISSVSDENLDDISTVEVTFDWNSEEKRLFQRQIYFFYNKIAVVISVSANESLEKYNGVVKRFLSDFKFRRGDYV